MDELKDIKDFLKTVGRTQKQQKLKRRPDFISRLNLFYPEIPLIEQIYLIENDMTGRPICICDGCNNYVKFHMGTYTYHKTCSKECAHRNNSNNGKMKEIVSGRKKTTLERYGVDNPAKLVEVQEKMKQTTLERFGVNNAAKSEIVKIKIKETNLDRYGFEYGLQNEKIKDKVKETSLARYGVPYPVQNIDIKNKMIQTNLDRYGVKYTTQIKEIRIKMRSSRCSSDTIATLDNKVLFIELLDKHGVENMANILDISPTTIWKYMRKYGISDGYKSNVEKFLAEWLDTLGLEFKPDRKVLNGKEIDRYCEEKKFGIEMDGLSSHSVILGDKNSHYHKWKTDECEKLGIRLIHIFEDEWYDRQEAVQDIIKTQLGIQERGIGARKLKIMNINNDIAHDFFESHHIQGKSSFNICLGAYDNDCLVGVMGFGKPTRQSKYQYELKRYCTDGKVYPGLASRLFQYFIKNYQPTSIVSFCDKRYFSGESYLKIGFRYDGDIPPDYSYTYDYRARYHKSNFKLENIKKKFPYLNMEGKTEWECMIELGFDWIWDCGKKRFVWTSKS